MINKVLIKIISLWLIIAAVIATVVVLTIKYPLGVAWMFTTIIATTFIMTGVVITKGESKRQR